MAAHAIVYSVAKQYLKLILNVWRLRFTYCPRFFLGLKTKHNKILKETRLRRCISCVIWLLETKQTTQKSFSKLCLASVPKHIYCGWLNGEVQGTVFPWTRCGTHRSFTTLLSSWFWMSPTGNDFHLDTVCRPS